MLKRCLIPAVLSFGLIAWGVLFSTAYADLSREILEGIEDGTRKIRPEVFSLKHVPVPEPSNLHEFVKSKKAAIVLGKALFWDTRLGSDGVQACASCHFKAGADNRTKNQLSPGLRGANQDASPDPDHSFEDGKGANFHLSLADFPHHMLSDPTLFSEANLTGPNGHTETFITDVERDTNDVVSSQGVHFSEFVDAESGQVVDTTTEAPDPDGFHVAGVNTRRVAPRNTPTVINAVFNVRQFWDGRVGNIFNGVNSFGTRDPHAFVYQRPPGKRRGLEPVRVRIDNGSLASQALAPPVNNMEISADGRTWIEIGDKFISNRPELPRKKGHRVKNLKPLASQIVHPDDSVLGELSAYPEPGLKVGSYRRLIRQAFRSKWWGSRAYVRINEDGSRTIVSHPRCKNAGSHDKSCDGEKVYSQMEMNFSLFFGLAVQLYQATLIADDTPVDRFLDGDPHALTESELIGFHIADDEGRCINCHGGPELTFASHTRIFGNPDIVDAEGNPLHPGQGTTRIRRNNLIDEGFNNIGVRPTLEDLGVGGVDELGEILSFARRKHLGVITEDPVSGQFVSQEELDADLGADGAFKIPGLRNVELTAPYFHNGGEATLEDVIDFYFRGGNFRKFAPTQLTDCASDIPPDIARLKDHPVQGFNAERTAEVIITGLGILRGPLANSGPGADTHPVGDCEPGDGFSEGGTDPHDGLDDADRVNLVAWMKALTDERVRYSMAPFDHPQLFVPNGHPGDHLVVAEDATGKASDQLIEIPAVGADGLGAPLPSFIENLAD